MTHILEFVNNCKMSAMEENALAKKGLIGYERVVTDNWSRIVERGLATIFF